MDKASMATLMLRVGTLLVAVALAFGMASYTSGLTVSGFHGDVYACFGCNYQNYPIVPAETYLVLASWNPASPQQMYLLNMSSPIGGAEVLVLRTNLTAFNVWIAGRSGLSMSSVSSAGPQRLSFFSDYLASHGQEVMSRFNIPQTFTVERLLVADIEPLMVVLTNGNSAPLNFTYTATNVGIYINPSLGYWTTGLLAGPGIILVAVGLTQRKRGPR